MLELLIPALIAIAVVWATVDGSYELGSGLPRILFLSGAALLIWWTVALIQTMFLKHVPLFFAVARLTRATVLGAREQSALSLGRAIAEQRRRILLRGELGVDRQRIAFADQSRARDVLLE